MNKLLLAAVVSALALPAYGQAVPPPGSGAAATPPATSQPPTMAPGASGQAPGRAFQDLDTDGNGSLSEREYGVIGDPSQPFSTADTNRDGRISRDEYAKWLKMQPDRTPGSPPAPKSGKPMGSSESTRP